MAGNSVAANLLMVLLLAGGFTIFLTAKKEVFPEFSVDAVRVSVTYPGASPEEVEKAIVLPVEEAVRGLEDVKEVRSTAREGMGEITVEAITGADMNQLTDDVKNEVDRITTFPEEAEEPEVQEMTHRRNVLSLMIYGNVNRSVLHKLGEQTKSKLQDHANITQVEVSGLPDLEISVEVPEHNLRRYGFTLNEIAQRVQSRSVDLPGGELETDSGEILVRMRERRDFGDEFRRMDIVSSTGGSDIKLQDIATINDGFAESDQELLYNGKPTVELKAYRVGDQTPIEVADAVEEVRTELQDTLPPGVSTAILNDRSVMYRRRANLMLKNGAIGLVLVIFLLGLFLEVQLAFWVMMGIPISFLGSFFFLPPMGVSINIVSMFAYIIALGIVVDDAIIVGENIFNYRQKGNSFMKAAVKGTQEVALPVIFAILTNIVAFMPLYFIPGIMGKVFFAIPVVVGAAFLVSLVECLYILPAHLAHGNSNRSSGFFDRFHTLQKRFSSWFMEQIRTKFGNFLSFALDHRYLVLTLSLSLLIGVLAYAMSGRMGMSLFPHIEDDSVRAELVFPVGTPVSKTKKAAETLRRNARELTEEKGYENLIRGILIRVGQGGSHKANVEVQLAGPDTREQTMSTTVFKTQWKKRTENITGIEYLQFGASAGPGSGADLTVELQHRNIDQLEKASEALARELRQYPMVSEINDGFQQGKPQFDMHMKPTADTLGLNAQNVGQQVRSAFYGARAIRQIRGENEIEILVKLPDSQQNSPYFLKEFMVRTPGGEFVPLSEVADIQLGRSFINIERRAGRRTIQVTADANPQSKSSYVLNDLEKTALPRLQQQFPGLNYSYEGKQADMRESLGSLKILFSLAMLGIFGLLAVPLRSYVQPLVIILSVPFGIIGAVLGHLLMGFNLSVISLMGVVALSGVVVNDALILTTFANRLKDEEDLRTRDAVLKAAIQRFRQVMLTSLTTFGGLAPLIFETSRQARFLIPMAISLGFGILFTFFIILVFTPSLYVTIEDIKSLFGFN